MPSTGRKGHQHFHFTSACRPKSGIDDRRMFSGIVHVERNGLQWLDAPWLYGPHKTRIGSGAVLLIADTGGKDTANAEAAIRAAEAVMGG